MGIKLYYHEILTAVVDLTQQLSTLSIWKISNLKGGGGTDFMFVPITLVMRCIWVCSNDSNEKDKMTMCKNRAGISMTRQTELSVWCTQGQRKYKIHDPPTARTNKRKYRSNTVLPLTPKVYMNHYPYYHSDTAGSFALWMLLKEHLIMCTD